MTKELTPLEALEKIKNDIKSGFPIDNELFDYIELALKEEEIVYKNYIKLKAEKYKQDKTLEIIKEKRVDVDCLIESVNLEEYNRHMSFCYGTFLTQEEFDLLKEALL